MKSKIASPLDGEWYVVGVVCLADGKYISAPQITQNPSNYANDVRAFYRAHPETSVAQFPTDYSVVANRIGVIDKAFVFEIAGLDASTKEVENV